MSCFDIRIRSLTKYGTFSNLIIVFVKSQVGVVDTCYYFFERGVRKNEIKYLRAPFRN